MQSFKVSIVRSARGSDADGSSPDLCNTFIHLKRPAQAAVSIILRRAIWAWIECFPHEFAALATSGRRLEGGADVLFDIIFSLSETSKKKTIAWQLMATLLVCCPDIVAKIAVGEGGRTSGLIKKVSRLSCSPFTVAKSRPRRFNSSSRYARDSRETRSRTSSRRVTSSSSEPPTSPNRPPKSRLHSVSSSPIWNMTSR